MKLKDGMDVSDKGTLYLVPTPIGNMEDMTLRAIRILQEVDAVAAEDTRHTGQLLHYLEIKKRLISYHEHNKEEAGSYLVSLLLEGQQIALCSDAGMPAISDPGSDLVEKCIAEDIPIVPLPGANAALTALIASGLDTTSFTFVGFLPKRNKNREEMLERIKNCQSTLLFYEAPHRLKSMLEALYQVLGNRKVTIARELTKQFETFTRSSLVEVLENFDAITLKGEFVVLVEGAQEVLQDFSKSAEEAVLAYVEAGMDKKEAIKQVAKEYQMPKRELYNAIVAMEK